MSRYLGNVVQSAANLLFVLSWLLSLIAHRCPKYMLHSMFSGGVDTHCCIVFQLSSNCSSSDFDFHFLSTSSDCDRYSPSTITLLISLVNLRNMLWRVTVNSLSYIIAPCRILRSWCCFCFPYAGGCPSSCCNGSHHHCF